MHRRAIETGQNRLSAVFAVFGAAIIISATFSPDEANAGFLDDLFGGGAQQMVAPSPPQMQRTRRSSRVAPDDGFASGGERKRRHASLNGDPHLSGEISTGEWRPNRPRKAAKGDQKAKHASISARDEGTTIGKYVCVRMCDGAVIALARRNGAPETPTCDNACPGTEARLFTLQTSGEDIGNAVDSVDKTSYADLVARLKTADADKKSCACASVAAKEDIGVNDFFADATLRRGDVVATSDGLRVFHGPGRLPHRDGDFLAFAETRARLPRATHWTLEAIDQELKSGKTITFTTPDK